MSVFALTVRGAYSLRLARKIAAKARQSTKGVPGGTFKCFNAASAVISTL